MSSASRDQENNPDPSKRRIRPDGTPALGGPDASTDKGGESAILPPTSEILGEAGKELREESPVLEPWRQQLAVMKAAAFLKMAPKLLERAGDLILFPTEHEAFKNGQEENVDRYIALRNDYEQIFQRLIKAYSWSSRNLPVVLGGLNRAPVDPEKVRLKLDPLLGDGLCELKQLCADAVGVHKEILEDSVRADSHGSVGLDGIADESDLLDSDEAEEKTRELFRYFDCKLRAVSNLCDWMSYYLINPDEAVTACGLRDFVLDKARALNLEGSVDPTTVIRGKLSTLAVVLEQGAHLLDITRGNALDAWRLERPGNTCLSKAELSELQHTVEAPYELRVDVESFGEADKRQKKAVMEVATKMGDSMREEYARAYKGMEPYFDALKNYASEQGIGFVVSKDRPAIQLFVDVADQGQCSTLTEMGPYPGQDGSDFWADEDADEEGASIDPRVVEDTVLSVSPKHKRGIFIEVAHAALASKKALNNFQAVREFIHRWADLEVGFDTATLKAYSPKGAGDGAGLMKKWEESGFMLSLTSTAELSPNFRLEQDEHPLSRALPCDEELQAEQQGWEPHIWGPTLTTDRTRRCLLVEPRAWEYQDVITPVEEILRHAHPLYLSVSVRIAGDSDIDRCYAELAEELTQMSALLKTIKSELGSKKLYLAQLAPERDYPGFANIVAVYNIYDSKGSLVNRVHVQKTGNSKKLVELVARRLDGIDLKMAEGEVVQVLAACGPNHRHTYSEVKKHFADRHIYLCDTVVQAICSASDPESAASPEQVIATFFRGPSVWVERAMNSDGGVNLFVFSQREGQYS